MSKTTIPKGGITADAIDATLIADDAISEEHIDATVITSSTALAAEPADTDEFLISDAGTIKRIDYSLIKAEDNMNLLHEAAVTGETGGSDDYTDAAYFHATNYDRYIVYIDEYEPQNDGSNLLLQLYLGDQLRTGSYEYHTKLFQSNSDAAVNRSADTSSIRIIDDTGNASTESARGWFEYTSHETDNAAFLKMIKYSFVSRTSGDTLCGGWGVGSNEASSGALYGFRLLPSAGGLGNYKIRIYGIKS